MQKPIVYFQHEKLRGIFIDGHELPNAVNDYNIRIFDGSPDTCALCKQPVAYFYIDLTLSVRQFLCSKCLSIIYDNRDRLKNEVDMTFQELVINSNHTYAVNTDSKIDVDNTYDDTSCAKIYDPDKADANRAESLAEYYIVMPSIDDEKKCIYLMSYDELCGSFIADGDVDIEESDLTDDQEYQYNNIWFKLPEDFMLI